MYFALLSELMSIFCPSSSPRTLLTKHSPPLTIFGTLLSAVLLPEVYESCIYDRFQHFFAAWTINLFSKRQQL